MKTILYMAMSIDGFIATDKDETPWSEPIWKLYTKFVKARGNLIVGRRTYEIMKVVDEFKKLGNPQVVVLSRNLKQPVDTRVHVARTPATAVKILDDLGYREIIIGGGGQLNASFLKAGLINEMIIDIEPTVIGRGVRMFGENGKTASCRSIDHKKIGPNHVRLHYQVLK